MTPNRIAPANPARGSSADHGDEPRDEGQAAGAGAGAGAGDASVAPLSPDVVSRFDGYGVEDGGGSVDKFAAFMAAEYRKWGDVVRAAKVTEES